jgi:hypothetical protein
MLLGPEIIGAHRVVIIGHLMVPLSTGHVCADSEENSPSLEKAKNADLS